MNSLKLLCGIPFIKNVIGNNFKAKKIPVSFCGLTFSNPVGLAAGFDKNARYLNELSMLGFSHVEIGTVTPVPQKGNPRPRLFRLTKDKALINRMGFNNDGAEIIASRLKKWNLNKGKTDLLVGGNIGKNKITSNEDAWKDYETCFITLHPYVDYFVVNVSSPNTPGLRELQDKESLRKIFGVLQQHNHSQTLQKPVFLKLAPDLSDAQIDEVINLYAEIQLDGLIIANTTISRNDLITSKEELEKIGMGGLSGAPLSERSQELISYIKMKSQNNIRIIASGGISNANDAKQRLDAGASLVQVWTGFIYEGPAIVKNICNRL